MSNKKFNISDRIKSFKYAIKGLKNLWIYEHNSRIHLAAAVLVIGAGIFFNISAQDWISLSIVIALVLITEIINTAIERLSDIIDPSYNKQIGLVKDYAAAAVLLASLLAVIVGGIVFFF